MKYQYLLSILLVLAIFPQCQPVENNKAAEINQPAENSQFSAGPEKGSLVVVGGAMRSEVIIKKFVDLAGGLDANIVVIPTASGRREYDQNAGLAKRLQALGMKNITVLHTTDPSMADTEDFAAPLTEATGVWFGGGRQWRLVDAYQNTLTEKRIRAVLDKGGVVGGSSAGATILGSYLVRGDTKNNQIMMGDHQQGFGYLKNVAIVMKAHPELLGIGIDENTAIVVEGNQMEVIGESYVLMYDGTFWSREGSDLKKLPDSDNLFYMLRSGDRYDIKKREMIEK